MKYLMFLFFMSFSIVSFAEEHYQLDDSNWIKSEDVDDFTGDKKLLFILEASSYSENYESNSALVIRCLNNKTEMFLNIGDSFFPFMDDTQKIGIKIDEEKAYFEKANQSADAKAVFFYKPINFLKKLKDKSKVIFRYKPINKTDQNATFEIKGINQIVDEMSETCKWPKK